MTGVEGPPRSRAREQQRIPRRVGQPVEPCANEHLQRLRHRQRLRRIDDRAEGACKFEREERVPAGRPCRRSSVGRANTRPSRRCRIPCSAPRLSGPTCRRSTRLLSTKSSSSDTGMPSPSRRARRRRMFTSSSRRARTQARSRTTRPATGRRRPRRAPGSRRRARRAPTPRRSRWRAGIDRGIPGDQTRNSATSSASRCGSGRSGARTSASTSASRSASDE